MDWRGVIPLNQSVLSSTEAAPSTGRRIRRGKGDREKQPAKFSLVSPDKGGVGG